MTRDELWHLPHKRFLVFVYENYYPSGGIADIDEAFDLLDEAIEYAKTQSSDAVYVYDRIEGLIVFDKYPD